MSRPPLLRDRLPEILGDRPWWDTPHSIRTRRDLDASNPYVVHWRGGEIETGFIIPDALREALAEILERERTGRPYLDPELWTHAATVRTPPRPSWTRRAAARLAALLERFAG